MMGIAISITSIIIFFPILTYNPGYIFFIFWFGVVFSVLPDVFTGVYLISGTRKGNFYSILWFISHPFLFTVSLSLLILLIGTATNMWLYIFTMGIICIIGHFLLDLVIEEEKWWL